MLTRPRASSRLSADVPSSDAALAPWRASFWSSSRWRSVSCTSPARASSPVAVSSATSVCFGFVPAAAPGARTSERARAGVEQYSRAIQPASVTRSGGIPVGSTASGSASRSGARLPVDAYYPGRRLVVVCAERPSEQELVFDELIPARGLRFLRLDPDELSSDRAQAELQVRDAIERLELPPPRVFEPAGDGDSAPRESAMSRMSASFAQAAAPPVKPRRVATRAALAAERQAAPSLAMGMTVGLALALALVLELFFGVGSLAMNGGHWVLALGLAFDCCARALGTVAAGRAGQPEWAWW